MAEQGKEPVLHNEALEAAVKTFMGGKTNENLVQVMRCLEKATVIQPAVLPKNMDPQKVQSLIQESQGGKTPVKLSAQTRPNPIVLKNDKGEQFFAVFTEKAQIPENQKYPAMMFLPFRECAKVAGKKELGLSGIVINPFTDNLLLRTPVLSAMNQKVIQVLMEDKIAIEGLSGRFFRDKQGFMEKVSSEKESFVLSCYEEEYRRLSGEKAVFPYGKEDFNVIALNISDTLHIVRISLAEGGTIKGVCLSAFCCYNPKTEESIYYVIQKGAKQQKNRLLAVDKQGSCSDIGEAPEEGSELYELIGKVPWGEP